jgi:hypothetical protein
MFKSSEVCTNLDLSNGILSGLSNLVGRSLAIDISEKMILSQLSANIFN